MDATNRFCCSRCCDDKCVTRISDGTTKNLDEHEPGRPAATRVSAHTSKISNTIFFNDKTFVLDFTSIATLFAFVLVCGGVLLIPRKEKVEGKFNMPYINGKF